MARTSLHLGTLVFFIFLTGCQTASRSTAPADLTGRLAGIEASRLSPARSTDGMENEGATRTNPPPPIMEQRAVADTAWVGRPTLSKGQSADQLDILTLGDVGSPPRSAMAERGAPQEKQESGAATENSSHVSSTERKLHEPPLPGFFEPVKRVIT